MNLYRVTNTVNGKRYIGITRGAVSKRWKQHCYYALDPKALLARAIAKHGANSFCVEVIGTADTWSEICRMEREAIAFEGTMAPAGYNLTSGGYGGVMFDADVSKRSADSRRGRKATDAHRAAISAAHKGRKRDPEVARKCGLAHRGKTISAETRAKMSAALRGRPHSTEHREKLAMALAARNRSRAQRDAVTAARKGKAPSDEARQKSGDGWRAWIAIPENRAAVSARIAESNRRRATPAIPR